MEAALPARAQGRGFALGRDYPDRIVDHHTIRQRTLNAYRNAHESAGETKV